MNNRGSALITGMIAALSVGVVSAVILQQSQVTSKQTRLPRIKSAMMTVEMQLREALYQQVILKSCQSGPPNCVELDQEKINAMAVEVVGAECSSGPCGISIQDGNYNPTSNIFTAKIVYNGTELSVAPVDVEIRGLSAESWETMNNQCDIASPLLVGFNPDGSKKCQALPSACPAGSYVRQIDPMSLTSSGITCEPFPVNVTCPLGRFISGFRWVGGATGFNVTCADLLNPFSPAALDDPTVYSYSPAINPVVSSWPTTTLIPVTTTTTTSTTTTVPATGFPTGPMGVWMNWGDSAIPNGWFIYCGSGPASAAEAATYPAICTYPQFTNDGYSWTPTPPPVQTPTPAYQSCIMALRAVAPYDTPPVYGQPWPAACACSNLGSGARIYVEKTGASDWWGFEFGCP